MKKLLLIFALVCVGSVTFGNSTDINRIERRALPLKDNFLQNRKSVETPFSVLSMKCLQRAYDAYIYCLDHGYDDVAWDVAKKIYSNCD